LEALMVLTILVCAAGWMTVSVLVAFLPRPMLRGAALADRSQRVDPDDRMMSSDTRVPARLGTDLAVIARVAQAPSPSGRLPEGQSALERLMRYARGVLTARRICLLVRSPDRPHSAAVIADAGGGFAGRHVPTDAGAVGVAIESGRVTVLPMRGEVGTLAPSSGWAAVAPIPHGRGVLLAQWDECSEIGPVELEVLCQLASFAGRALSHQARSRSAADAPPAQVRGLLAALAEVDGGTCDHSLETADLAVRIGKSLGLDRPARSELELGALLHDVGKLCVPTEVLVKAGPLSDEEWRLVRRHPRLGADIVAAVPGLEAVALIVLLHHERPDGGGYPYGLAYQRIPMASRIVSVCDAYGAMTSGRPYRARLDGTEALEELRRGEGSQFDPQVVDSLASVVHAEPWVVA
jgi:HD-GYP domain-containing protein (c-di-GMP phosphodiesterase class II)